MNDIETDASVVLKQRFEAADDVPQVEFCRDGFQQLAFVIIFLVLAAATLWFGQGLGGVAVALAIVLLAFALVVLKSFVRARRKPYTQWVLRIGPDAIAKAGHEEILWTSVLSLELETNKREVGTEKLKSNEMIVRLFDGQKAFIPLNDLGLNASQRQDLLEYAQAVLKLQP